MKDFFYFIKGNFRTVSFGWLLTFLSAFGQTFLISLYVPEILRAFSISEGAFGAIYAGCTVAASFIMLSVGHTVDHIPVKKVTAFTVIGLALSSILLGLSNGLILLILAITGLRLTGQGFMTHISMTIMSKQYGRDRGKALSFSSLGFSVGEAIFPLIISFLIAWWNWRVAAVLSGAVLLLYLFRLKFTDLNTFDERLSASGKPSVFALLKDYKQVVFDSRFGIMMPASFIWSFSATAIFFYQYVFVENKGWSVQLYAAFFTVYAVTRFLFSLFGGVWVDKYTAKKMFRYYLIPASLGLLPFAFMNSIIGALLFLITAGITMGISGTVKTSLIAELYGIEKMGAIRSVFTMFSVISTALGPLVVGLLMDAGVSFEYLMGGIFALMLLIILNSQRIRSYS
ncbi:Predicted arabinose efflux permease, MFS family [Salinimicrobium catena]|uniref:Predicted arabinose efflux permease, MFS family n=1 Tax=Salinimicrobium catena TaxID=390640 RepID=A0A1H5HXI0_9FLAO|nr:MFS transporter [Salinimicrobium catena]SDK73536.1 Predicted arabinose efflux permease, MFS family [Salinimicrobium catena]SEE32627.1 Predicted arabinose efflux permease, MFS family [Salinimicrobium catena]